MSASNVNLLDTNVSNFVSAKLSGKNYDVWKSQMLCMLVCNNMGGIVDSASASASPRNLNTDIVGQYDSLARGWILGSLGEDILPLVHNLSSAKDVWKELKLMYDPQIWLQKDTEKEVHRDLVSAETYTVKEGSNSIELMVDQDILPTETGTKSENKSERLPKLEDMKGPLYEATKTGDWSKAEPILKKYKELVTEAIYSDGSTLLHVAVSVGHKDFVKQLLWYMNDEQLLQQRDSDGSTSLHIAAFVGNTDVADLLVKRNKMLLWVRNDRGLDPLQKAYEYMHLDTIACLLKAIKETEDQSLLSPTAGVPADLIELAIYSKQYSYALKLVQNFPKSASRSDKVLMALAKNFPSGLDYWETLVHPPSLRNILRRLSKTMLLNLDLLGFPVFVMTKVNESLHNKAIRPLVYKLVILTVPAMLVSAFGFIWLLILIACFPFQLLYYLLCKTGILAVAPIKRIVNKKKDFDEASRVLCNVIEHTDNSDHFDQPILEAACRNAYLVVQMILDRSIGAINSIDKNGHDFILLAILNRSEKVYNLIYDNWERKNMYRTYKDSSQNNILHLVGKLAPSSVLNQRTGAALQLQRELQWREEVKKFVYPPYTTQENILKETPDMVFIREHKELVKEGEQWMKTTAESCSITAALITTIVFAAAITVPGGSNQDTGTPLFKKETAFIIFAISDAISLFASSTALLVFLSILTTRFAEKDFLVSLPRRLFIGLLSLLVSTTTMMIAFSATVYIVFCDKKPWMLLPIASNNWIGFYPDCFLCYPTIPPYGGSF
ncbi:putative ankyrin repeat-containing domain, PGG domain, ankyrin repeat-containing domain superfamily [Helianthus annuus]|nr:putative ankyrin repeat-containing domain, PGG domain, ankyrin repeat-containing domain superfamily [Helianthus annuus]